MRWTAWPGNPLTMTMCTDIYFAASLDGGASFLPEEREWFEKLVALGLHDGFRLCHADEANCFSWFDYRSRGFEAEPKRGLRIDHFMVSELLRPAVVDAGVDYDIRGMEKPSDHAPVWIEIDHPTLIRR